MNRTGKTRAAAAVPPPQQNLQTVTALAVEALRGQSADQLAWLGARRAGKMWRLDVLNDSLDVDISSGAVRTSEGREARAVWRILTLHYLTVTSRPESRAPEVTFADLPAGRAYAGVYHSRVIARLCATVGRDLASLSAAAAAAGARAVEAGDAAFEMNLFPRIAVRLIWHAGDEEFGPSATLLLPANIESFLEIEDVVVLSESLVSRMSGRGY